MQDTREKDSNKVKKYYAAELNHSFVPADEKIYGLNLSSGKCFVVTSAFVDEETMSDDVHEVFDLITGKKIIEDKKGGVKTRGLSFRLLWPFDEYECANYVAKRFKDDATIIEYCTVINEIENRSIMWYDEKVRHGIVDPVGDFSKKKISSVRERARRLFGNK